MSKELTGLKHTCSKCGKVGYSKVKPGQRLSLPKGWTVKVVGLFYDELCKECSNV